MIDMFVSLIFICTHCQEVLFQHDKAGNDIELKVNNILFFYSAMMKPYNKKVSTNTS